VAWTRAALVSIAAGAVAIALVSGGSSADPRTPGALPGLPPPFLGTAVAGSGGLTAAVDAYGDVVDLRAPGPAGAALIDNPAERQAAGSVPADTGIVPRVSVGGGPAQPLWRADSVAQRYLPGTNVVRTVARFGRVRVAVTDAVARGALARTVDISGPVGAQVRVSIGVNVDARLQCEQERKARGVELVCGPGSPPLSAERIIATADRVDRRWISRAKPLAAAAPGWAWRLYWRSLLTLRALTDRRTGAVAAGARDGWAYVWPRDAGGGALAFAAAGYRPEARRIARFLLGLDLGAAGRFDGEGAPVAGREVQGDASGWVAVAARAAGLPALTPSLPWQDRADYQEGDPGMYLANAIVSLFPTDGPRTPLYGEKSARRPEPGEIERLFGRRGRLVRRAVDPASGLDSAAAWAVRPFAQPALFPAARRTLLRLAGDQTRFGIAPGAGWPGFDPWTAPTAWTAWSLAALGERREALRLLGDLRRAATSAGALPERVDARTGIPTSTTPLAWSHAFAILALRELWPQAERCARRLSRSVRSWSPTGLLRTNGGDSEDGECRGDGFLGRIGRDDARGALHAVAAGQLPAAQGHHGAADRPRMADLRERSPLAADRDHNLTRADHCEVAGVADATGDDLGAVRIRFLDRVPRHDPDHGSARLRSTARRCLHDAPEAPGDHCRPHLG
jgi:hypothetical protein